MNLVVSPSDWADTSWSTGKPGPRTSSRPGGWGPHRGRISVSGSLNATQRPGVVSQTAGGALYDTAKQTNETTEHRELTIQIITFTFKTSLKTGSVVCFFTAVFSLVLFSGSTHSLTYLRREAQDAELGAARRRRRAEDDTELTGDISSSWGLQSWDFCRRQPWPPDRNCWRCSWGKVPVLPSHWRSQTHRSLCCCCCCCPAGGPTQTEGAPFTLVEAEWLQTPRPEQISNSILIFLPSSLLNTQNQRRSLLLPQWKTLPGHCLFWTGLANWDHGRAGPSVADGLISQLTLIQACLSYCCSYSHGQICWFRCQRGSSVCCSETGTLSACRWHSADLLSRRFVRWKSLFWGSAKRKDWVQVKRLICLHHPASAVSATGTVRRCFLCGLCVRVSVCVCVIEI